ncbi:energy transducer TonB [Uliginosibacterium aquaticum]|uniref:Energy transducer TonB n=1 Tax=Uliginosibacterium aquaticum TaxID=2731212 RepID=A0ABX2ISQ2_9RHOO|nr:energy transducer TonB [Uliginosibacterium aquaticum]NSL57010.1 energy transducer TonB [Uliginosibacterium aquaticum]
MLRNAALTLLIAVSLTACTSLEKDDEIQSANQIPKNGAPIYPKESRNTGEEGTVFVYVLVGKSGDPVEVKISKSSGFKALDDSAISAVKSWKFSPARNKGQPIEAWLNIPIAFKIEK